MTADPSISGIAVMGPLTSSWEVVGPLQFSITVPANTPIDQYRMIAFGIGPDGTDVESVPVSLAVENPLPPVSIQVDLTALHIDSLGDKQPLQVTGFFADGSHASLTHSINTTYSSSNPGVVIVDSRGWTTAVGPGIASITVTNPGGSITVPVKVTAPANPSGDVTPPSTTVSLSPGPNTAGWNNSDVTVTLTSQDEPSGSGVSLIAVQVTGAESMVSADLSSVAIPTISAEGVSNVTFFGVDNAGNRERPHSVPVRLDRTPPAITGLPSDGCSLQESHSLIQVAVVSATDSLSGLATFNVSVTSNQAMDPTKDLAISGSGLQQRIINLRPDQEGTVPRTYTFAATATDVAGNSTSVSSTCKVVDN